MRKDEPAFPVANSMGDIYSGMSLRDYFAAMALNGLLQNMHAQGAFNESLHRNVDSAYMIADAMLEKRDERSAAGDTLTHNQ